MKSLKLFMCMLFGAALFVGAVPSDQLSDVSPSPGVYAEAVEVQADLDAVSFEITAEVHASEAVTIYSPAEVSPILSIRAPWVAKGKYRQRSSTKLSAGPIIDYFYYSPPLRYC